MTRAIGDLFQDAMQGLRRGHVVTDMAHTYPECWRPTSTAAGRRPIDRCPTCGMELPGAVCVPRPSPVGVLLLRAGPRRRGVAFPGREAAAPASPRPPGAAGTHSLRRLPLVARQLRWRQGDRPPFRVEDDRDLVDAITSIVAPSLRRRGPESRTPRYAAGTRTDYLLAPERAALTVKHVRPPADVARLSEQLTEDAAYYRSRPDCGVLVALIYDPEGRCTSRGGWKRPGRSARTIGSCAASSVRPPPRRSPAERAMTSS